MENFEFYNPVKIIFGAGEVSKTGEEAKKLGIKALVVSYEEHSFFQELLDSIEQQLDENGVECVSYYKVTANPTLTQVSQGVEKAKTEQVDFIIGVGGGSAMDAAKIIAAGVEYKTDIWKMIVSRHDDNNDSIPPDTALPLLMVPTLPATGSEMNCGAVVTNEETNEKSYVFAECIYPKVSIIDPELTCSLPAYQTACGAADAISHAMETYLNGAEECPIQEAMLEAVIKATMDNVKIALAKPGHIEARTNLQWAAILAWNGWLQAGIGGWAPMHQFGHVLSAHYNVTHGASLSIAMPAYMRFVYKHRISKYVQFAKNVLLLDTEGKDEDAIANEAIDTFENFLKEIGVQTRLADVNINPDEIPKLVEDVVRIPFGDDGMLNSCPKMDAEGVKKVFELAC